MTISRSAFPTPCGLLLMLLLVGAAALPAATLPSGFAETRIASGLDPTTMAFAADGRLFLCEKPGRVRLVRDGALLGTPVLDISGSVDSWNERGLESVCIDPDFANNGWIYLYYTAKAPASHNRVARFTVSGDTAAPGSQQVLVEITDLSSVGWHNGGGLRFGKDGKLYVSTGENANGGYAQSSANLLGKLLRFNKDGSIPTDNPHYGTYSGTNRAIVALGLRNPFTIAVQPGTGLLYVNMVGANYEQIERYETGSAAQAVNYGWPGIDGPPGSQTVPADYRAPTYAYDHGGGQGTALCGGDFYNPAARGSGAFPASYDGRFFFSDYRGWIKYIDPAQPGTRLDFATAIDRPIDVQIAPDGSLWYIARAGLGGGSDADNTSSGTGSLWRVTYTGGGGPTKLAFVQQPTDAGAGAAISPAVSVAIQDASGQVVTTAGATVTLSLSSGTAGSTLSGTLARAAMAGVATFPGLTVDTAGSGFSLRAASSGLTAAGSASFTVRAQVEAPIVTPGGGTFSGPIWVQITSPTPGAAIHYTTDGSTPGGSSATYAGAFQISASRTVKAEAEKSGLSASPVTSAALTITGGTPYGLDYRPAVTGVAMPATASGTLPATLSATGLFSDVARLKVKAGIVPYTVNSPLWSDNAVKQRWVLLPTGGRIGFAATGEYAWPAGTILIKHFELVIDTGSGARRRLETRVLVQGANAGNGYGVTYRWRSDNSDADLVGDGGQDDVVTVSGSGGHTQTWHYPARSQCLQCHTGNAGFVLGPKTRQLNGVFAYPGGRSDNQLRTWSYLQMFSGAPAESAIAGFAHTVTVDDASAPLEARVRSYLDANCAHCHRPGGTGAQWDGRFDTPLASQGIIDGPVRESFGIAGAAVVAPGDLGRSIMHLRLGTTDPARQMPPLARNVVDATAVAALAQWIGSLPPGTGTGPVSGATYTLTAKHSGKLLDVFDDGAGALNLDGTYVQQWTANGKANQQWKLDLIGGWWRLTCVGSGKVLDVPGASTNNSVALQQWVENGGTNQRWSFTDMGGGLFRVTNQNSGKNLDVDGASTADGARIHQYQDNGNDNQRWILTRVQVGGGAAAGPVSGAIYTVTAKHSGKLLDLFDDGSGVGQRDGTFIQQWGDHGGTNQRWRLDDMGGGFWRFTNARSGKVLDVPGNSTADSVVLHQWTDNGGDNQRWSFTDAGGGWSTIACKHGGELLDVTGASLLDGARINQYHATGGDNQLWRFDMVAPAAVGLIAPGPRAWWLDGGIQATLLPWPQER